MKFPDEQQWLRAESLHEELRSLLPEERASRISRLAIEGESRTVITVLKGWLDLPPPALPFLAGDVIGGRYTLREKIGEGGMGSVWRAEQTMIGRDVALKMIHTALVTPNLKSQFVGEIEVLGRLSHPGIVRIFDAGIHEQPEKPSIPFFTMELVDGIPLDRWAGASGAGRGSLLRVMTEVCEAVQGAHERRVVHRDLKPSNILVRKDGHPVVLDFGIARLAGTVSGDETGEFSGTPLYAAPEQHLGHDNDFRSGESVDVYSTGVILFQILSGRRLFVFPTGASLAELRKLVVESPAPRLSSVMADCPPELDDIVARALRKDPADRFYSMASLGRAIGRASLPYGEPTPPSWAPSPGAIVPGTGWKLKEKLGQGGTGEIWLGFHEQLGERRVFKFCDTEEKARTLKRELTLYRLLKGRVGQNPHFVQIHEVSLDEPPWYLMMDYTEAKDLQAWAAQQPGGLAAVPIEIRVEIIVQVAEALQAAHEAGILHRDIKPANLLVRIAGGPGGLHVMIADFGIGQIIADELLRGGTRLGFTHTVADLQRSNISGTLMYMAPEVLEGNATTARSDIYSLGVVLWQLLIANLSAALDPADWSARISDPLLREDLARCLAGSPERRWASAGALAASLRDLSVRRDVDAQRAAEIARRERLAYRRGVLRTALAATAIIAVVAALGWAAWRQRKEAMSAHGQIALEQAASLPRADTSAGRTERGLQLLETAAAVTHDRAALRSAAAAVLGMSDLRRVPSSHAAENISPASPVPTRPGEICRTVSHNRKTLAVAFDLDGLNGAVELLDAVTGNARCRVERKQFPWIPVAERSLFCFSPDDSMLAIGGAATSRHILLCNVTSGSVHSYLFHGSDPASVAWHPAGRVLASGCVNGTILVWDTHAAVVPTQNASASNQFDLPPRLDVPANDVPLHVLRGHKGAIKYLTFSRDGRWLASLDDLGYLRIHTGFDSVTVPPGSSIAPAGDVESTAAVEARLEHADQVTGLEAVEDGLVIRRTGASSEEFRFQPGELPMELRVASGIGNLAWNSDATEICAISLTDVYWLKASPLELLYTAAGKNPVGVAALPDGSWALPGDNYREFGLVARGGKLQFTTNASFQIAEAVKGQGARVSLAAARDGRVAAYRGRRIQFFQNHKSAPRDSSITADGGNGEFRQVLWGTDGAALAAVFALPDSRLHVETWATSADFPPHCGALAPVELECELLISANRGQQYLGRSKRRGIFRFDAQTGSQTILDSSNLARQDFALAASADGRILAMIVDRNNVRLLKLPEGTLYADFNGHRPAQLLALCWDNSGHYLAGVTEDGSVDVWNLGRWHDWLSRYAPED